MEDRRVGKSKNAIKKVFLEHLKNKPLNKISVAQVSREANVGRKTFYLHYEDIYDLYDKIESEIYSDMVQIFEESYPDPNTYDLVKLIETITKYIADNKDIFFILTGSPPDGKPMQKLKNLFHKKLLQRGYGSKVSKYDEMECLFIVSGIIGVVENWLYKGLVLTQKEIANILYKIVVKL